MTNLHLEVPDDDQTLDIVKKYYQFQIESGGYDSSTAIEDRRDYQQFRERFEKYNKFRLSERITNPIREVSGWELESIAETYGNEDWTVSNEEGLSKLIEQFEISREDLDNSRDLDESTNHAIQKCLNLIRFAKERGYGVTLAP